jgi:hypothetical protein
MPCARPALPAASTLNKEQCRVLLTEHGILFSSAESVSELRSRISEIRGKTTPELKGLTGMSLAKLREACDLKDIPYTGNEIRGQLMRKIREHSEDQVEPKGVDTLAFGKHRGKTYLEVKNTQKTYCTWAKTVVQEDPEASPALQRFVKWLNFGDKVEIKHERETASSSHLKKAGPSAREAKDLENDMIHEMGPEAQAEMRQLAARMAELRTAHGRPKGLEETGPSSK